MHNRVLRKTMENLRKKIGAELVYYAKDYIRYISKPSFVSQKIFSSNFAAIHQINSVSINQSL